MGDVMSTSHGSYAEWAAKDGRREDLEFHVKRGGPTVLIPRDSSKTSLLHEAAGRGHVECVKVLLQYGECVCASCLSICSIIMHLSMSCPPPTPG